MKAIILAAGKGERLRPLTNSVPKCLVPLSGRPLLSYWLESCQRHGFDEVLVNGHYLADALESYLDKARREFNLKINYVYESELYGTGGTVKRNRAFVEGEDFFLLCHGDNFTNIDLSKFRDFHISRESRLSVALFETNVPKQCGIAEELGAGGRIIRFREKPENPVSNLASAAIFLMSPEIIESFPGKEVIDFSKEVLPLFQGKMFGHKFDGFNIDIGTIQNYETACLVAERCQA